MDQMSDRKIVFIVVLVVVLLLVAGAFALLWTQREGSAVRSSYLFSGYEMILFGNLSEEDIENIELVIPFPTMDQEFGESEGFAQAEDTIHGAAMRIKIHNEYPWWDNLDPPPPNTGAHWRYDSKLTNDIFSTQENQTVWIYANLTNINKTVYFSLIKEDEWSTLSLFETQVDYVGVLNSSFAPRYSNYNDRHDHVRDNVVELKDGWHQYTLVSGTYNQYAD